MQLKIFCRPNCRYGWALIDWRLHNVLARHFAYDPVTKVNDGYGVCGTSGSGGSGGVGRAGGGGKCGIADGGAIRNAGYDVKPMLARRADVGGA